MVIAAVAPAFATDYTPIDYPGSVETFAEGIDGNNVVGYYDDGIVYHGFLFDGSSTGPSTIPWGSGGLCPSVISGTHIVGAYDDYAQAGQHGFVYDGSTYKTLDDPLANGGENVAYGISAGRIVGRYVTDGNFPRLSLRRCDVHTIDYPNRQLALPWEHSSVESMAIRSLETIVTLQAHSSPSPTTERPLKTCTVRTARSDYMRATYRATELLGHTETADSSTTASLSKRSTFLRPSLRT